MDSHDHRGAKRARTQSLTEGMKRGSVWYDDGSLVLQVQQTQFRVSQPGPEDELVDGCPVVELSDNAEDWQHVLTALFGSHPSKDEAIPLTVVAAYLRLGKKYAIAKITADAIGRLSYEYPTTLPAYQALTPGSKIELHGLDTHFDVLSLIRETGTTSFLPTVLYRCSALLPEILKGAKRADGSLAILTSSDQQLCILGFQKLCQQHTKRTLEWIDPGMRCGSLDCLDQRLSLVARMGRRVQAIQFSQTWPGDGWSTRLCAPDCQYNARYAFEQGQLDAWGILPRIFDLPGWGNSLWD